MGKALDKIILTAFASLILFLLFLRWTNSLVFGTIASLLTIGILFIALNMRKPRKPKDRMKKRDFIRYVLLNGNGTLKTLVEYALRSTDSIRDQDGNTILERNGKRIVIYYAYKFGSLSEEDVAKSYRIAKMSEADEIYALTNHTERKALAVSAYIPQKFVIINATQLYKFLLKRNLIPKKENETKEKKRIKTILASAIGPSHARYFIFAGIATAFIALFTPFVRYYIVFSIINLILACLSIFQGEKGVGKDDVFDA